MAHRFLLALVAAGCAFAQTPAFEVVSIKPAQPMNPQAIMAGKMKIGEAIDGTRADYGFVNVEYLITKAYGVKSYQVTGPSWIQSERYDIIAKLPEGATKEQVPDMLKAMLAERFKIEIHKDKKEHAVYALVIGKGGSKLKESVPEAASEDGLPSNQMKVAPGADGRSMTVKTGQGNVAMTPGTDGTMHMQASQMAISSLIEMLTRFVDKPVLDQTDLKGKYDIGLDISMADLMNIARASGAMIPGGAGGGRGPGGGGAAEAASDPSGGSIFQAIEKLGLKLEPRKLPLDMIVVDKGDKVPTEN